MRGLGSISANPIDETSLGIMLPCQALPGKTARRHASRLETPGDPDKNQAILSKEPHPHAPTPEIPS